MNGKLEERGCLFCNSYSTHLYGSDPNKRVCFEHQHQNLLNIDNHGTGIEDFLVWGVCNEFLDAIMSVGEK